MVLFDKLGAPADQIEAASELLKEQELKHAKKPAKRRDKAERNTPSREDSDDDDADDTAKMKRSRQSPWKGSHLTFRNWPTM